MDFNQSDMVLLAYQNSKSKLYNTPHFRDQKAGLLS